MTITTLSLRETVELHEAVKQTLTTLLKRANFNYIVAMECLILSYQRAMWLTCMQYSDQLERTIDDSTHHHPIVVNLVADLQRLGEQFLGRATNAGYERALQDLQRRGWISGYESPVVAPRDVAQSAIQENRSYLETSLLPDLAAKLDAAKLGTDVPRVFASVHGRLNLYGHYLWRAGERSYTLGLQEFSRFYQRQNSVELHMREGGSGSGNWDHAGRPGQVGGSASVSGTIKALRSIANIHAAAKNEPDDPATRAAYNALITQTNQQYEDLKAQGYKFNFTSHDPYETSQDLTKAVDKSHVLNVYNVVDFPSGHPLSQMSPYGQTENSIFRAVHDMNGHYLPGNTFGERGELKAYQAHAKMYSDTALPALAAETLAQNAWINHDPSNEGRAVADRTFADQKAYAFPLDIAEAVRDSKFPRIHLREADNDDMIVLNLDELDATDRRLRAVKH